nr:prepilin-type N-terminal cleavage/methylation domain-containing protein [Candidatus Levybacteria bacterium]
MMINQRGQTLIEALIALAAASVIISAIAVVVITSMSNSTFSKNQNLATHYAQQGIDIVRSQSESDWIGFLTKGGVFCLGEGATDLGSPSVCSSPNINNFFVREITITQNSSGCGLVADKNAKVVVKVSWADGKCSANIYCHSVSLDTCLANINTVSAP